MRYAEIIRLGLAFPGTETGTSYGTAALKVRGKLLARLNEDGETLLLCAVYPEERALLIEMAPAVFHVTAHYERYPTMLIRLGEADPIQMRALLLQSWGRLAPAKSVRAFSGEA